MIPRAPRRVFRSLVLRGTGLAWAMLAVLLPVLAGPVVHAAMMREAAAMDHVGDPPMCADMAGMDRPAPPAHPHHAPDCAVCPLCAALAHPAVAWAPVPEVPLPTPELPQRLVLPPGARAPPPQQRAAAQPRGPPAPQV